ncbi:hypothetical protein [Agriterribacter sp.]|uniref:hypothetical protein n=1 Tax=Agriterribacter sp. TaxID=2821509 RepID=UPI002BBF48F3|nr:hypothetical protein [Agriterribacter sp.]HTN06519.1 hypothetical protein [Agriterribacter sp.]
MGEKFELPVHYKGQDMLLPAELKAWKYSHSILVTLNDQTIIFEPDEERNYRALLQHMEKPPDLELIRSIAVSIELLFK